MARIATLLYFRKIFLLNVEKVPKKGPLLLVCNHPSSFFEACVLAVLLPRPLFFLTRGDLFKKPLFSWFLRQTHQIPIFRIQDGFDKLRNNPDTFAFCYQALREQKAILIFPESWTILEKRLRPMQKGAARLALGALKYIEGLQIMPIGITFSNPMKFRSLVTIQCGMPIPVTPPVDPSDERTAMADITAQIENALRALIIHIDKSEREPVFDVLQEFAFNSTRIETFPVISSADKFPNEERRLAAYTNNLSDGAEHILASKIKTYVAALKRYRITDRYFVFTHAMRLPARLILLPGTLLLILGKAFFILPATLIVRFVNVKIHKLPFYGPVKWVMGFYLIGPWCLLCLLLGYLLGDFMGFFIALIWLMLGHITLLYFHDIGVRGFLAPLTMTANTRKAMRELRSAIVDHL